MKKILLMIAFILFGMICSFAQGPPGGFPTGGNGGGPPPPPSNYCNQNPSDPACQEWANTTVPVGDWKWQLGLLLAGSALFYYQYRKKFNINQIK